MYRTRSQSDTAGVLTWTFDRPFSNNPVVTVTVEDTVGGSVWNHSITALSTTAVTIQLVKTTDIIILTTIHVLGIAATPQAWCHITAVAA